MFWTFVQFFQIALVDQGYPSTLYLLARKGLSTLVYDLNLTPSLYRLLDMIAQPDLTHYAFDRAVFWNACGTCPMDQLLASEGALRS